jgi:hypothetical protein
MARTPISQTLVELEALAQSITPEDQAEMPPLAKLQGLLKETRKLLARRDSYQARKQEARREARERIRNARVESAAGAVAVGRGSRWCSRAWCHPFLRVSVASSRLWEIFYRAGRGCHAIRGNNCSVPS